jgi:membrane protein implicated in regulation of membrane protease activity
MALRWTFLGAFLIGLILAVRYMIIGVEKASRSAPAGPASSAAFRGPQESPAEYRTRVVLPAIAGFGAAFGVVGYALTRLTLLGAAPRLGLAGAAGLLGAGAAVAVILSWAVPSAKREVVDERFTLMGHLARVTRAIGGESAGEIEYEMDGRRHTVSALSLEGGAVAAGTEVVIERVENGHAYVEPWLQVERRL